MHLARPLFVAALAATLAACPQRGPSPGAAPMADAPIPADTNFIHGRATYLERLKMPPGADFTVQLVDAQLADTQAAVVAETTLEDVAGPPYDFALQYDPAKVHAGGRYALRASLRGADGSLLFATGAPVPVVPGDARLVEFRLVRVATGDAARPPAEAHRTRWTCGGMSVEATFDVPGGRVELALPEGPLSLPLAMSASGARYADHRGNAFWTKGPQGTLTLAGREPLDCLQADAPSPQEAVWEDARQRGIAFRAIGNEPGWLAEIGQGERPPLHAELDYGERRLDVAAMQPLSGLLGYAGTAADGTRVRLVLERRECSDGMSDARYPVAATLEVGTRTYSGCGRFLVE